ncbi:hypothetical protein SCORR_v1c04760 [Spiroplasma corruscae]|uniref:Transmembrane protein n=1 Tax=Spiroplasma corruscae TaxID=216934 RepID=A0A222EP14_9MOLU|nr:hypothetical protein [Spiroplasma corruscae]ASP28248.1 hypothetical protein SCORR_v1c04760 [Spiroplasma corruscae]
MANIKILKENRKSVFMLTSLTIFSLILITFSVLMMFSPIMSLDNLAKVNEVYSDTSIYTNIMSLFYKVNSAPDFSLISNIFMIVYLPLSTGLICLVLLVLRLIIHSVGYKSRSRKGIVIIVKPVRSYQLTMMICWLMWVILTLVSFLSYLSASPFLSGVSWFISLNNSPYVDSETIQKYSEIFNNQFKDCYWLTFAFFSGYSNGIYGETSDALKLLWIFLPFIPQFIFIIISFIGTLCGECSWGKINVSVIRDLDLSPEGNIEVTNNLSKRIMSKKININKISSSDLQARILLFYKNFIRLLELSDNTKIPIYKESRLLLEKFSVIQKTNWKKAGYYIEEIVDWYSSTDQKFVKLISQLVTNPKNNLFKTNKEQLYILIKEYQSAINKWNLLDAEFKIEQIFALTIRVTELLAKVGYCLKTRLANNFDSYENKVAFIDALNNAKLNKNYNNYRDICIQIIKKMSPEKVAITDFINKTLSSY